MGQEELTELIRAVIAEDRAERITHPEQREKYTRFEAPDGRTWTSMTLEKGEMVRKSIVIITAICVAIGAIFSSYYEFVIYPRNKDTVQQMIHQHEVDAQSRMEQVARKYALDAEFKAYAAQKEQKWADQERFNARVEVALIEIQKDIKELLRRK